MADGRDLLPDANGSQCFDRLRTCVDGGADLSQRRSRFKNLALIPNVLRALAAASPARPPPTIAIL